MTTFSAGFTAPGTSAEVLLVLDVTVVSQDTLNNTSTVSWNLYMQEYVNASPYRNYHDCVAAASVGGSVFYAGNLDYNFDGTNEVIGIASDSKVIAHNADGTKTIDISASYDGKNPLGTASFATSMTLPAIPRNRAKVGVSGTWKLAEVYVGINGSWVAAKPYVGVSGAWKEVSST